MDLSQICPPLQGGAVFGFEIGYQLQRVLAATSSYRCPGINDGLIHLVRCEGVDLGPIAGSGDVSKWRWPARLGALVVIASRAVPLARRKALLYVAFALSDLGSRFLSTRSRSLHPVIVSTSSLRPCRERATSSRW